jgi:hypothetical protein
MPKATGGTDRKGPPVIVVAMKRLPIAIVSKGSELGELIGILLNQSINANEIAVISIKHCHEVMIPLCLRLIK